MRHALLTPTISHTATDAWIKLPPIQSLWTLFQANCRQPEYWTQYSPTSGGWWWLYVHSLHTSITEHLVLHNEQVSTECLLVQLIGMILVGQVEQHLYKRQGWLVQRYNALHSCNTKFGSGMCMYNTKTHTCAHIHVHKHAHTHKHTHTSTAHTHTHSHICTHPYTLKTLFQVGCRIC